MTSRTHTTGRRETRSLAWHEIPDRHCTTCGRPLARTLWVAELDGVRRIFCGEDCERLARERRSTASGEG